MIAGRTFSVLPAVTCNHVMIDLHGDQSVRVGDEAVLFDNRHGSKAAVGALAEISGGSEYKFLINLNPELRRVFPKNQGTAG